MKTYPFSLRDATRRARIANAATARGKRADARRAHIANAAAKQGKSSARAQAPTLRQDIQAAPVLGSALAPPQDQLQHQRASGSGRALLQFILLLGFSTALSAAIAVGTDPNTGFLPIVLEHPPGPQEPIGFRLESHATRVRLRGAPGASSPQMVRNMGEHFAYPPEEGLASWYGYDHLGRRTATGAWFNPEAMTVAHRTFPLGSLVRVTRTDTGESITAEVNDRGPYVKGRIVDLARKPAKVLGILDMGIAPCRVELLRYPRRMPLAEGESLS